MSKRIREKNMQSLSNPQSPTQFRSAGGLPNPTVRLAS
jgi:hypothetical protein